MSDPTRVDIPNVGLVEFPAGMSDDQISIAAKHLYDQATRPSDSGALSLAAAGEGIPLAGSAAMHIATSPTLPKTAGLVGRIIGAVAPPITGAVESGPLGTLAGLAASAKSSWLGGKTGYFTGRLLQNAMTPIAKVADRVAPYAQGLSTLAGAQGVNDLAQMAEPNRRDIGFLGIGPSVDVPGAQPPLINSLAHKLYGLITR